MVRVTHRCAAEGVPDVCEFAVFNAVEPNIGHCARLLRGSRTGSSALRRRLDSIVQLQTVRLNVRQELLGAA